MGAHDIKVDGEMYSVEKIYMHNHWQVEESHDLQDMAIYKLDRPLNFSDNVRPVCLPNSAEDYTGVLAYVAGWGTIDTDTQKTSNVLLEAKVTVKSDEECQEHPDLKSLFKKESMMCAFAPNKDSCQGDSGGPLFHETSFNRYEQIGKLE